MTLTSTAFNEGGKLPCAHVASYCAGQQTSPPLAWTAGPAGTQSYAIVMRDDTLPNVHWVLYDIPAAVTSLAANVQRDVFEPNPPAGSKQSKPPGSFGDNTRGYFGACPVNGAAQHTYSFTVYARPTAQLGLNGDPDDISSETLAAAVTNGALASATITTVQDAKQGVCN